MSLRELVEALPPDWKPKTAPFPATLRTAEALHALETGRRPREAPQIELPALALARLRRQLVACHQSGDWSGLSARDWRFACECLALDSPSLIDEPGFVAAFIGGLEAARPSRSSTNLLARWYVRNFEPGHQGLRPIGAYLAANSHHLRAGWAILHETFGLFDPNPSLNSLAGAFVTVSDDPATVLHELSCQPSLLFSRLFGHVFVAACRLAAEAAPRDAGWIKGLTGWAFGSGGQFQHGLIPGARPAFAEALLRPWAGRQPTEEARSLVVPQLLELMQDPRTNPAGWTGVSETARQVMLDWMTRDALEQFLEVVDESIQQYQSRMWAERRQFWMSYSDRHDIHECWVVFGRRGAALARHLATRKNNPSLLNFANFLRDVGGDPNQAVLLMKIGPLLVADWSHNGRCHIWLPGNPASPQLYQPEYLREDLMSGADFEIPHHKNWQTAIDDYISGYLGLTAPG